MLQEKSLAFAGDRTLIAWSSSPPPDTILTELPRKLKVLMCKVDYKNINHTILD
jgi:hypothetical protein